MKTTLLFCLLAVFGTINVFSQGLISVNQDEIPLTGDKIAYIEDKVHSLTIEQIVAIDSFKAIPQVIPNFANTSSTIWIKFKLQKLQAEAVLLEIANPMLDNFILYHQDKDGKFQSLSNGSKKSFREREYQFNNFVLTLPFDSIGQSKEFYLQIRSDFPIELPLKIWTLKKLAEHNHVQDVAFGIYFGFLIVMVLYNLFVFFTVKDSVYLYYIAYSLLIGILYGNFKGYSFQFLWGDLPRLNFYVPTIVSLLGISILFFARNFLNIPLGFKKINFTILFFVSLFALVAAINLSGNFSISAPISQVMSLLMALLLFFAGVYTYFNGVKIARFYILAWSGFLCGAVLFMLQVNAVIPSNFFTQNAAIFGSALEVVLLSFALADRINVYKKSAEKAQKEALKASKEKEQLIKEQNIVLEQKIGEATEELRMNNEELQTLNEEINSTNEELNATLEALSENKRSLEITNAKMNDSVRYAKTIQAAILPFTERLSKYFHDYFIIYQPKDIVSGDFYWLSELNGKIYFAVADCTGHGVPGAFMSMIGAAALDALVDRDEISDPAQILEGLDAIIRRSLKQAESQNEDGMDIALCVIEQQGDAWHIAYAGAHRPLRYIRASEGTLTEIRGTKRNIGGSKKRDNRPFEVHRIVLAKGDCLYLNSDGMADQNNAQNEKFGTLRVKALLEKVGVLDAKDQKETILAEFAKHQGREEQRDDITMIGVRI